MGIARLAGMALLVAAIGALLAFGVAGIGREGTLNFDGRVMYAAGRAWLAGLNPYDHDQLARAVAGLPNMDLTLAEFLYPPQAGALCVVIGALPYAAGRAVWLLLNLAAIAAIAGWAPPSRLAGRSPADRSCCSSAGRTPTAIASAPGSWQRSSSGIRSPHTWSGWDRRR